MSTHSHSRSKLISAPVCESHEAEPSVPRTSVGKTPQFLTEAFQGNHLRYEGFV
jgi:hypothetical protein